MYTCFVIEKTEDQKKEIMGTVYIKLFDDIVPNTARHFRNLVVGHHNFGYCHSTLHRIIPKCAIQAGIIMVHDERLGTLVYDQNCPDENFRLLHDRPGLLSMVSRGRNTSTSEFFITTAPLRWLDGFQVVFGEVADSKSMEVIDKIDDLGSKTGTPLVDKIEIVQCGLVGT